MRTSAAVLLVAAAFALVLGQEDLFIEPVTECPDHPRQCYDTRSKKFYKSGEKWYIPGKCYEYRCNFPDIDGIGCGTVGTIPPCYVVTDTSQQHPDCCPRVKCPWE